MNSARCVVVVVVAVVLAMSDARAQDEPIQTRHVYLRGCSFVPPEEGQWVLGWPGGKGSGQMEFTKLVSQNRDTYHQTTIGVRAVAYNRVRNCDELLAVVRGEMQSSLFSSRGARLLGWEAMPDSLSGLACVRYRYRYSQAPQGNLPASIHSVYGIQLVHPGASDLRIRLYCSDERYLRKKGAVAAAEAEPDQSPDPAGEQFFRSLKFVERNASCRYSDTLGYNGPQGVAIGHGSVWVAQIETGEVLRIDPSTGRLVARVAVGRHPVDLAITEDAVWVANSVDATVSRIDPRGNQVAATVKVGKRPFQLAAGPGAVWVTNIEGGTVSRIDLGTNRTEAIKIGGKPCGILYHEGVLWVTDHEQDVVHRLDPQRGASLGKPISVGSGPNDLAFGAGSLWVNCQDQTPAVCRVDPLSGAVLATIPSTLDPSSIAFGRDRLWISDYDDGTVTTIDPATNRLVGEPLRVGISLVFIRAAEDGLWVTDQIGATVIRVPYE